MSRSKKIFSSALLLSVTLALSLVVASRAWASLGQLVAPIETGCDYTGECWVIVSPALTGTGCSTGGQVRFRTTDQGAKAQWQAAITAQLAGKKIDVQPGGCTSDNLPWAGFVGIAN